MMRRMPVGLLVGPGVACVEPALLYKGSVGAEPLADQLYL